jgi:excisionase family DNA binding protein
MPQSKRQLNETVSTTTAATILGITDRAVRRAITEKRLTATTLDGRYRIDRDDLAKYLATRNT